MKFLISIIVPVYNPGSFLKKCIESLVNQTKKNYEVILVDDGSTDDSSEICREYCQKYDNIKYFYKENSGVSDTRNFGIEKSCGEYITFVDSDDYIDEKYTGNAEKIIQQGYEMVIFNHANVKGESIENIILQEESQDVTCPKILNKCFETYCLNTVWKIIYKRDLLIKNSIVFDKTINYGEDMLFSITAYLNSKKTYYLNYCGYFYVLNDASATFSQDIEKRKKHCYDNLKLYENISILLKEKGIEVDKTLFLDALLRNFLSGLNSLWLIENKERNKQIKEILKIYHPYIKEYEKNESSLNKKMKLQLQLIKKRRYLLYGGCFWLKRIMRKIKTNSFKYVKIIKK